MATNMYILNADGEPEQCRDLLKFDRFMADNRRVAFDELPDGTHVSTVFLGIDHGHDDGPPVLWETIIFGGPHSDYQTRYRSHAAALIGHDTAVRIAKGEIASDQDDA